MKFAISNPVILKNNFVDLEKAGELLKKGISILGNVKQ